MSATNTKQIYEQKMEPVVANFHNVPDALSAAGQYNDKLYFVTDLLLATMPPSPESFVHGGQTSAKVTVIPMQTPVDAGESSTWLSRLLQTHQTRSESILHFPVAPKSALWMHYITRRISQLTLHYEAEFFMEVNEKTVVLKAQHKATGGEVWIEFVKSA